MTRAPVTAIIPAYNAAEYVGDAIRSVLEQTLIPESVLVIDDGSTDDTPRVLETFGDRIRVIRQENRGLPGARNTGIRAATTPLLGFLDADDAWLPDMVAEQVSEFAAQPTTGLCFTDLHDCDHRLEPQGTRGYRRRCAESVFEELYLDAFPMPPSTVFVRREVFDTAGLFDESMRMKQDIECWLRIAMHSRVSCLDRPLLLRRTHGASITQSADPARNMAFELLVFEKCGRAAEEHGVPLPMTVEDRQTVLLRRRLRDFLRYGDRTAADCYRNALASRRQLRPADRLAHAWGSLGVSVRRAASPLSRRLRGRR